MTLATAACSQPRRTGGQWTTEWARDLGDKFPQPRSSRARQTGAAESPIPLSTPLLRPTLKVLKEEKPLPTPPPGP